MPVEIRELKISLSVNKGLKSNDAREGGLNKSERRRLKKEIMEECVEKMKNLIEKQTNR